MHLVLKYKNVFIVAFLKLKKLVIFMISAVPLILFGGLGHVRKAICRWLQRGQK